LDLWGVGKVLEKKEPVVLLLGVHAVVGLYVGVGEDWVLGVVQVLCAEDFHGAEGGVGVGLEWGWSGVSKIVKLED